MTTPILGIAEVSQSQSSKEVTINNALRALENATQQYRSAVATAPTNLSSANFTANFYFNYTGTPGAWTLNVPATERAFYVMNNTNGDCTVQVTGGAGNDIVIAVGEGRLIYSDGADVFEIGGGGGAGAGEHLISTFFGGDGIDENVEIVYVFTRAVDFADDMPGSIAHAQTVAATGSVVIDVQKNGSSIGSITFAVSTATAVFTTTTATSFAIGDRLHFVCPAAFDSLAGIAITLVGTIA